MLTSSNSVTVDTGAATAGGAEVAAYDAARGIALVLGPDGVSILNAATGAIIGGIPASDVQVRGGGAAQALGNGNSVAVSGDTVAIAFDGAEGAANGFVAFFTLNADGTEATWTRTVTGPQFSVPDQLVFTPDGSKLLVAIEAEPRDDFAVDGKGGIAIIDVATGARTIARFNGFNNQREELLAAGVRLNLPDSSVAQDLEPEYITVSSDGATAYATLQENNAIAEIDIASGTVLRIMPLGAKDHSVVGQGIDPSDEDGVTEVREVPVSGLYMPDGIASFERDGKTYLVTANEGDARDWDVLEDEERVGDLDLDPTAFPDAATLQLDENLGRLNVSTTDGDTDGDGDYDALFSFGARSFTIWEVGAGGLTQTFDSGDLFEQILIDQFPELFDDGRSDNKGPEPESITLGEVDGTLYAFVALERSNATIAFEIVSPTQATYAGLFTTEGDEAPEVIVFVPAEDAPDGVPLLIAPNEGSGTTTIYEIEDAMSETFTLQILHASDWEAGVEATTRAPNFAAIVDALEETHTNSITLLSGDNFIPGPFTAAGTDPSVRDELASFYEQLFGLPSGSLVGIRTSTQPFNALDIAIANAMGVQVSVFGNHEFDLGTNALTAAINSGLSGANATNIGALFPYLSANVLPGTSELAGVFTSNLVPATDFGYRDSDFSDVNGTVTNPAGASRPQFAPWTTIEENGETIGVLGITTQILAQISSLGNASIADPAGDGGVDNMSELASILQPLIDQMTGLGIDKIILLAHLQQIGNERQLATLLNDVDIIFGGGSNTIFADATDVLDAGDVAGGVYPEFYDSADGTHQVALVNTDGNYNYVGRLVIDFDANGEIITGSVDEDISGAYVTTDAGVDAVAGNGDGVLDADELAEIFADGTRGGEVKQLADAVAEVIQVQDGNVVGFTDVFLEGRRAFVRSEETNLGNLTADANLAVAKAFDLTTVISIKNGGGIRAEIGAIDPATGVGTPPQANPDAGKPEGGISQLDIQNSLRFNNGLSLASISAQGIKNLLENAVRGVAPGATPGAFPQISGLKFSFDPTRTALDRVLDVAIVDQLGAIITVIAQDGTVVGDPTREYRIATLNFLLPDNAADIDGGDGIIVRGAVVSDSGAGLLGGTLAVFTDFATLDRVDIFNPAAVADFETVGREQSALADYLASIHGTEATAFDAAETPRSGDTRTQNLTQRAEDVIGGGAVATAGRADLVVGTAADENVDAGIGNDSLYGVDGDDTLLGGGDNDLILGGEGDDVLRGGSRSDTVAGGDGADRITGNRGSDLLTGGEGADRFIFTNVRGGDTITDFTVGEDKIVLTTLGFADFDALLAATSDGFSGALITFGDTSSVTLLGVSEAQLIASDFVL